MTIHGLRAASAERPWQVSIMICNFSPLLLKRAFQVAATIKLELANDRNLFDISCLGQDHLGPKLCNDNNNNNNNRQITVGVFSLYRSFGSCRGRREAKEVKPGQKLGTAGHL